MQKLIIKLKFTHTFSHVFFYKFYSFMLYISSLLHFDYLIFFLRWRFVSRFMFLFTWASKSPSTSWGKDILSHLNAFALLSNIILLNWHGYISGFPFLFNVYVYFFTNITPSWLCGCSFASVLSDLLRPPWTVAHQALLSVGFPRQEYWSRLPPPAIFLTQGSNPHFLHWQGDSLPLSHQGSQRWLTQSNRWVY